jgi:PIN domain nuclease of toxin-antitoxin system
MSAVIADTHALVWYIAERSQLSVDALQAMEMADIAGEIYVPSIVLVELRYLVEKRTITETVFHYIADSLADPASALKLIPLDLDCAKAVGNITRATVPDMPDRIIAATGLEKGFPIVTRDHKIRAAGILTIW